MMKFGKGYHSFDEHICEDCKSVIVGKIYPVGCCIRNGKETPVEFICKSCLTKRSAK